MISTSICDIKGCIRRTLNNLTELGTGIPTFGAKRFLGTCGMPCQNMRVIYERSQHCTCWVGSLQLHVVGRGMTVLPSFMS